MVLGNKQATGGEVFGGIVVRLVGLSQNAIHDATSAIE